MKDLIKRSIPTPLKRATQELLRRLWVPPGSVQNLLAHEGTFNLSVQDKTLCLTHTNRWIENDLFWKGALGYEGTSMKLWLQLAKAARSVVDVGANTGIFALFARCANANAKIYAFEPMPQFYRVLEENNALNGANINVYRAAMSDKPGTLPMYIPAAGQGNVYSASLSMEHYLQHQTSEPIVMEVPVKVFDEVAVADQISNVDLVKVDAEGFDANVIRGMSGMLHRDRPSILIEIQNIEIGAAIEKALPPGYRFFSVDENLGIQAADRITKGEGLNYLLTGRDDLKLPG